MLKGEHVLNRLKEGNARSVADQLTACGDAPFPRVIKKNAELNGSELAARSSIISGAAYDELGSGKVTFLSE